MREPLTFPMTADRRARTYAVSAAADEAIDPVGRDAFISEIAHAWRQGYAPEFDAGKAEGAAQVRRELSSISEHPSFPAARDLALGLYFATDDANFVLGVLNGIGQPSQPVRQDTAPALFLRQNGYEPEAIGTAIVGGK